MKKKIYVILLVLSFILNIPIAINADTYGDFVYKNCGDHIEIIDCRMSAVSVDVPAIIDGLPVTKIGERAFCDCESLKSVNISESVTEIGEYSFYGCGKLRDVNIPDNVMKIGYRAFAYTLSGEWIDGLRYIGSHLIDADNEKISGVCTIRNGTKCIADKAFLNCDRLGIVNIPYGVTAIGDEAFKNCEILSDVTIPGSVKKIGHSVFGFCRSLLVVNISEGVTYISPAMFYECSKLESIYIPSSLRNVGKRAFYRDWLSNVYYSGNEEKWGSIDFNIDEDNYNGNDTLMYSFIHYNYNMPVSKATIQDDKIILRTNLDNLIDSKNKEKSRIYAALYDKNEVVIDSYCEDYNGTDIEYELKNDVNADHVKVFVWNKDGSLEPLTNVPEYIDLNNN